MLTTETETLETVLAIAVNDDDSDTWPVPGTHESFAPDVLDIGSAPTVNASYIA
jgi:hypothetical protein